MPADGGVSIRVTGRKKKAAGAQLNPPPPASSSLLRRAEGVSVQQGRRVALGGSCFLESLFRGRGRGGQRCPADSPNGCYGILDRGQPRQSALIPAARITLPHFAVSAAMNSPKSAGEPTSGVPPRSASRSLILGSARPALISLLSLSTISTGVFLGAPRPDQLLAS